MIARYTRDEMGRLWVPEARFHYMLQVEVAVAEVQADVGMIPKEAAQAIRKKSSFSYDRILEIEKETRHDVIAFVSNVAENVGEHGRYVHFGLTSSDVLDTALSLQVREAGSVLLKTLDRLRQALEKIALREKETICAGRTHGMHAEPLSFGLKMAGFLAELDRNIKRVQNGLDQMAIGKISGAVGTYSALSPEIEAGVCKKLQLTPETVATQVIPRDRHGELFCAIALLGGGLERLAVELRHLQRTELQEVVESFQKGQKGSSAMPHKKNPISAENITGCARLLRSYAMAALEDIALWHERDISHSSVERVVFPDAFILADYAADRMAGVIEKLEVLPENMRRNMDSSQGQIFSSHILLALIEKGLTREEAYALVQKVSHSLKPGDHLREALLSHPATSKLVTAEKLDEIFSGAKHRQWMGKLVERAVER